MAVNISSCVTSLLLFQKFSFFRLDLIQFVSPRKINIERCYFKTEICRIASFGSLYFFFPAIFMSLTVHTVPRNLPWAAAPKKYKIPRSKGRLKAIFNFLCTLNSEEILNYLLFYKNNKYCFVWVYSFVLEQVLR